VQNLQAFQGSRTQLKTGQVKRFTNLTAKSKDRRRAARRGVGGRTSKPSPLPPFRSAGVVRAVTTSAFSIVGVGASAGGLEAFTELFPIWISANPSLKNAENRY